MQRDRALNHLRAIRREVDRLIAVEQSWFDDSFLADDRIDHRAEWANMVDRFSAAVPAHADGQLDPDVVTELTAVARLLATFAPALERMQLRQIAAEDLRRLGVLSIA